MKREIEGERGIYGEEKRREDEIRGLELHFLIYEEMADWYGVDALILYLLIGGGAWTLPGQLRVQV